VCLTFCNRFAVLYWNHDDCHPLDCAVAEGPHGRCDDCRHRGPDQRCGLTHTPLPEAGGCCHWNVEPVAGPREVTRDMLAPIGIGLEETEVYVLRRLEVPYELGPQGEVLIEPARLGLPLTFGQGTDHRPDEVFDWSAWTGQWCREELEC